MTNKKLNLSDLKVESFVTSLKSKDSQTLKAGATPAVPVANVAVSTFIAGYGISLAATILQLVIYKDVIANDVVVKDNEKNKSEKDK